jgi:DNA-binding NarL/FixJ family response regulator
MPASLHVLLADPDATTRKALILLFKSKLGILDVREVADGAALALAVADSAPDLLLLDWSLPGRPAGEGCRRWRQAHPDLRVAILSVDAATAAEAEALGAVFIHKGSAAEQVLEQLRGLLQPN